MHGWLRRSWPALALVAVALALRCYGLAAPLLDYHSWRQADTAAIARNYATNGYRLLFPQVDWGGQTPGYVESEFPLYAYSLALLYGAFGIHEWLGRLLTALAGAAAVAALYGLVLASQTAPAPRRRAALYAALALALMPFPIYFGRTVMPDTLMLAGAILAIWTFQRWLARPSPGRLAAALLCGTLAPLAKTPNLLIVAVPLAYLIWAMRPPRRSWPALACYGACFLVPSLLWLRHAHALPLDPRLSFGIGEKLFDLRLLRDPQFYLLLARLSVWDAFTPAGVPFFALGLLPPSVADHRPEERSGIDAQRAPEWLPHAWLLGVGLFLFAGAAGVAGQDYYILPIAGPAAMLIGSGMDRAQHLAERYLRRMRDERQKAHPDLSRAAGGPTIGFTTAWPARAGRRSSAVRRFDDRLSRLIPAFGLAALAALSCVRIAPLYRTADFYRTLGHRLDLALPEGARVGVIAPAVSEILYYAGRKGWRLDPGVIVPGGLASLQPDLGVRYLLICDPWLTERREVLAQAVNEYRRIHVGPYALLLDLAQPGLQGRPAALVWETGHLVEEPFLSAWKAAGGVARLGYPLSDALDGPEGRMQYFERGLLISTDSGVERAPIGRLLLAVQGRPPQPAAPDGPFRAAWEQAGGAEALGAAISPVLEGDGGGQIQYFEYGTLEASPGGMPVPGLSGRRLLEARGLSEERQIALAAERDQGDQRAVRP
jgi:hypothetical protein